MAYTYRELYINSTLPIKRLTAFIDNVSGASSLYTVTPNPSISVLPDAVRKWYSRVQEPEKTLYILSFNDDVPNEFIQRLSEKLLDDPNFCDGKI